MCAGIPAHIRHTGQHTGSGTDGGSAQRRKIRPQQSGANRGSAASEVRAARRNLREGNLSAAFESRFLGFDRDKEHDQNWWFHSPEIRSLER